MTIRTPECMQCGACCAFSCEQWVEVYAADAQHIPPDLIEPVIDDGEWDTVALPPFAMRTNEGRCIALEGKIGEEVRCTIYDRRPTICRRFQRGSHECAYMLGHHHVGRPW